MSSKTVDNICVVCFKNVSIFSIGCCDHIVCFECSTRMRVLCRQNECPICRQDMQLVIFTREVKPFAELKDAIRLFDKKYNIGFASNRIQDAFFKLLEHNCCICRRNFANFNDLSEHVKRVHDLFFCELCVTHLKILTSERKCYNKSQLAQHRRKGDVDDKSHKGHPLCEFCDTRYMDNDELFRHLRRDHLYCHFCDADGQHYYYNSYDCLREHFREEHYLCEEGNCIEEKFTPVFRTEIDLKAHRASEHGRSLGKTATKQARTLEVEFTLKPRARALDPRRRPRGLENGTEERTEEEARREPTAPLTAMDFPTLGDGGSDSSVPLTNLVPPRGATSFKAIQSMKKKGPQYDQHFPGLPAGVAPQQPSTSVRLNITSDRKPGSNTPNAQPNVSIHVNHRPGRNVRVHEAFPALGGKSDSLNWVAVGKTLATTPAVQQPSASSSASWTAVSKKAPTPAPITPAVQPQPQKPRDEDFPTLTAKFNANLSLQSNEPIKTNYVNLKSNLSKNKPNEKSVKKASSVTIPVDKSWPAVDSNQQPAKGNSKKKKKATTDDTAKKKEESPEKKKEKSPKKDKNPEKKVVENVNSAFDEQKADNVPPLPTAADWFGTGFLKDNNNIRGYSESDFVESVPMTAFSKLQKPPPGFAPINGHKPSPPPGFEMHGPVSNGLTFTNSSGEMFAIEPPATFLPPYDFDERNIKLVTKVNEILLNDKSVEEFRWKSAAFRRSEINADDYIKYCLKTMGNMGVTQVLPELLVLLPDITKQIDLLQALERFDPFTKKHLQSCSVCRQVVKNIEMKSHLASHVLNSKSSYT